MKKKTMNKRSNINIIVKRTNGWWKLVIILYEGSLGVIYPK